MDHADGSKDLNDAQEQPMDSAERLRRFFAMLDVTAANERNRDEMHSLDNQIVSGHSNGMGNLAPAAGHSTHELLSTQMGGRTQPSLESMSAQIQEVEQQIASLNRQLDLIASRYRARSYPSAPDATQRGGKDKTGCSKVAAPVLNTPHADGRFNLREQQLQDTSSNSSQLDGNQSSQPIGDSPDPGPSARSTREQGMNEPSTGNNSQLGYQSNLPLVLQDRAQSTRPSSPKDNNYSLSDNSSNPSSDGHTSQSSYGSDDTPSDDSNGVPDLAWIWRGRQNLQPKMEPIISPDQSASWRLHFNNGSRYMSVEHKDGIREVLLWGNFIYKAPDDKRSPGNQVAWKLNDLYQRFDELRFYYKMDLQVATWKTEEVRLVQPDFWKAAADLIFTRDRRKQMFHFTCAWKDSGIEQAEDRKRSEWLRVAQLATFNHLGYP